MEASETSSAVSSGRVSMSSAPPTGTAVSADCVEVRSVEHFFKGEPRTSFFAKGFGAVDGGAAAAAKPSCGPRGQDCAREEEIDFPGGSIPSSLPWSLELLRIGLPSLGLGRVMLVPSGLMMGMARDLFLGLPLASTPLLLMVVVLMSDFVESKTGGGTGRRSAGSSPPLSGNMRSSVGCHPSRRYTSQRRSISSYPASIDSFLSILVTVSPPCSCSCCTPTSVNQI